MSLGLLIESWENSSGDDKDKFIEYLIKQYSYSNLLLYFEMAANRIKWEK